jgi:hypothetical protein
MVLVSIIVALAITHLLMAIAETIHRIRGLGEPIRLGIVYSLWIVYVFIWLVSFWWWEFKFQEAAVEWSLGLYFFIVAYAALLFLLATILVPHRMRGVSNGYEYFMQGRKWFFGVLLLMVPIEIADSFLKGDEYDWRMGYELRLFGKSIWVSWGPPLITYVVGIFAKRRALQLAAAILALTGQLIYLFQELHVLGL